MIRKLEDAIYRVSTFFFTLMSIKLKTIFIECVDKLVASRLVVEFLIGQADLLIASISLANRATLVTRNTRHFKQIPGVRVVNWVD